MITATGSAKVVVAEYYQTRHAMLPTGSIALANLASPYVSAVDYARGADGMHGVITGSGSGASNIRGKAFTLTGSADAATGSLLWEPKNTWWLTWR